MQNPSQSFSWNSLIHNIIPISSQTNVARPLQSINKNPAEKLADLAPSSENDALSSQIKDYQKQQLPVYITVRRNMGNMYTKDTLFGYFQKYSSHPQSQMVIFEDIDSEVNFMIPKQEILAIWEPNA
ncbi:MULTISPECIES: hypothetical protein [Aerococcus]|uniref:Uncharacterized protein n=2 Tax=Aerococcus TaxID=1375 RepID=A0A178HBR6_9LACT|nr:MULTISPECIES: hypothetical protein [Aerococcus]KAA9219956.1 hypothetical protein F6I39_03410 [Aerococcus loyolae]KAA9265908.1 hypothetical protein F6I19_03475 [Aerococcus loyolae]MCY3026352.1 hypothetical protein [Aerococcus loyolae]MCY3026857.1 hypothetical protein [Aerococcus loyolae]MCY3028824.1 hypothetical protein [Aerococcus loyolae]